MINLKLGNCRGLCHLFLNVMYNVDGPKVSPSEIVSIAPGEG